MTDTVPKCGTPQEFRHVQPDARIEVWTDGKDRKAFDTVALIGADDGSTTVGHDKLFRPPGGHVIKAKAGFLYTLTFLTRFNSQEKATAFLNLQIIKGKDENGQPVFHHRTPYRCSISGKNGDGERHHHFVVKVKKAASGSQGGGHA